MLRRLYWHLYGIFYCTLTRISPRLNTIMRYRSKFKCFPNLNNPESFNEKLLKIKLENYNKNPLVNQCADKYAVRAYVENRGLGKILIPLLGHYLNPYDINWDSLPNRFVIKWNFGCHLNIICKDKQLLDKCEVTKKLEMWKSEKFHLEHSELQYKIPNNRKCIIIEPFLDNGKGECPEDYKLYCYDGKPMYILLCSNRRANGRADYYYFDFDWNFYPFDIENKIPPKNSEMLKPKCLDEMYHYASILSKGFPFVRVDFYEINQTVYFGELTFTPCACMDQAITHEANMILGKPIQI